MTLRIAVEAREQYDILRVGGEVDYSNCAVLAKEADRSFAGPKAGLIADLREVSYLDSPTVGRLLYMREQAAKTGKGLALVPGLLVEEMLEIAGLAHLFTIRHSIEEAVETLAAG